MSSNHIKLCMDQIKEPGGTLCCADQKATALAEMQTSVSTTTGAVLLSSSPSALGYYWSYWVTTGPCPIDALRRTRQRRLGAGGQAREPRKVCMRRRMSRLVAMPTRAALRTTATYLTRPTDTTTTYHHRVPPPPRTVTTYHHHDVPPPRRT